MDAHEVVRLTELEDRHWWYAERRAIIRRAIAGLAPGIAVDVGAAGGGNTRVLADAGWFAVAAEYGEEGAAVAHQRDLPTLRADARLLPVSTHGCDLVVAFDLLEHIEEHEKVASEIFRILRPGGRALLAVPADPALWSAHDQAVGHVRRYTRDGLHRVLADAGLRIDDLWGWNVLLRPLVALRRRRSSGSDLEETHPIIGAALRGVVALERMLPALRRWPSVSLMVTAHRPES